MQYPTYGSNRGRGRIAGSTMIAAEPHCAFPGYFATLGTPCSAAGSSANTMQARWW